MTSQHSVRLGLDNGSRSKPSFLDYANGRWRVWFSYAPCLKSGVYMDLYPDGTMTRVTLKDGVITDETTYT